MIERLKGAIASEEFKNIARFENPKGTVFSLDNIFYGSMLIAIGMFLAFAFKAWGMWTVLVPIAFVVLAYVGRFIKLVMTYNPIPPASNACPVVEEKPFVAKPKTPRKRKSI